MSDEGAGVVTAEDHGRRGSHHSEERRVLRAFIRRHSCTFLGAIQLQGRLSCFFLFFFNSPLPTVSFGQVKFAERGRQRSCQQVHRCRRGKWRNGKSHVTEHLGRIHLCVPGEDIEMMDTDRFKISHRLLLYNILNMFSPFSSPSQNGHVSQQSVIFPVWFE